MGCGPQFVGGSPAPYSFAPVPYAQPYTYAAPVQTAVPQSYPQTYSQPQPVQFPSGWQGKAVAGGPPAPPSAPIPGTKCSGKIDDDDDFGKSRVILPPAPVTLPPPSALGIGPVASATTKALDWNAARARLDLLGASFSVTRLPTGSYRMVITLPTANAAQAQLVEVEADSEAVAVSTALARAEQLRP